MFLWNTLISTGFTGIYIYLYQGFVSYYLSDFLNALISTSFTGIYIYLYQGFVSYYLSDFLPINVLK